MVLKPVPFFLAVLLLVSGCAHYPPNARLTSSGIFTGYRFQHTSSPTNSPDLLLMLAFSGGGTRAVTSGASQANRIRQTFANPSNKI